MAFGSMRSATGHCFFRRGLLSSLQLFIDMPIIDDEKRDIFINDNIQKHDLHISDKLPTLVGYNYSSFDTACTKGCSWSPDGERLLVAAEDARDLLLHYSKVKL